MSDMKNGLQNDKVPGKNIVVKAAEELFEKVDDLTPYGTAERLGAGICMGIPFFLMVADICYDDRQWWYFPLLTLFFVGLPYAIINLAFVIKLNPTYDGLFITVVLTITLMGLYFIFTKWFDLATRDSISAYVQLCDGYIFGSLLMAASGLFVTNGLVYWKEQKKDQGVAEYWRPYGNVFLGVALIGVLHFPYNRTPYIHYASAIGFFVGCGLATVARSKTKKKHHINDFLTAIVMAVGFALLLIKAVFPSSRAYLNWITLFGAESVGLWVIGTDFILVSLKRVGRAS